MWNAERSGVQGPSTNVVYRIVYNHKSGELECAGGIQDRAYEIS